MPKPPQDPAQLPDGLVLSYVGDDFTGSTDVLEALARAGLRTALFLEPPDQATMRRFPGLRAVGVASTTRSLAPAAMEAELTPIFTKLRSLGAPLVHYKICSTFDSSPQVGSIGYAIDLGQEVFRSKFVPLVVGAPVLARYVVFGNLFARSGLDSDVFRLDRHPTMRRHPVTPMDESDLRLHLARQTARRIALYDVLRLAGAPGQDDPGVGDGAAESSAVDPKAAFASFLESDPEIVLFDTLTNEHLAAIGQIVWSQVDKHQGPLFAVGSSGIEYALIEHWRAAGLLASDGLPTAAEATDRLLVVSGSCSPVTAGQIDWALQRGFAEVRLETSRLCDPERAEGEMGAAADRAALALKEHSGVIVHTCRGPEDPRIGELSERLAAQGVAPLDVKLHTASRLGQALGRIAHRVSQAATIRRIVVTGGDTSGFVARELGIEALEMLGPMAPGSPLCRVHAKDPVVDGLQITFKGGQVGRQDFFASVLAGGPSTTA